MQESIFIAFRLFITVVGNPGDKPLKNDQNPCNSPRTNEQYRTPCTLNVHSFRLECVAARGICVAFGS